MQKVSIIGLGMMAASLGLALKKRGFDGKLVGYARRSETTEAAVKNGVVDFASTNIAEVVRDADLVILCVPVLATLGLVEQCKASLKPSALVTDVGSTKVELCGALGALLGAQFIGSHPIAGSEKTGVDAGNPDLYADRLTVITPSEKNDPDSIARIEEFWKKAGSRTLCMSAEKHDQVMARTSHLPHLVASTIVQTVARSEHFADFCGSGFKDTTRVASGSPEMWRDIVATNSVPIIDGVRALKEELDRLIELLEERDPDSIEAWLRDAAQKRDAVLAKDL